MKILHADDHPLFREGIRFFLKLLDAQVTALEAGSLQATMDKLALEWPSICCCSIWRCPA
jgi:DNA-binding NarL/FixJ family response regulator